MGFYNSFLLSYPVVSLSSPLFVLIVICDYSYGLEKYLISHLNGEDAPHGVLVFVVIYFVNSWTTHTIKSYNTSVDVIK